MHTTQTGKKTSRNPWVFVPSLYFAEGIPYVVIMTVSVIMYKRLGLSNADIALYTSWLYLPWVIKPLWSPVVDLLRTKRFWIVIMQFSLGLGFLGIAGAIPLSNFLFYTLAILWILAFSSATHDIAADGFYMLSLTETQQAYFVGIRSTFYRLAMITGQGILIILAGYLESVSGLPTMTVKVHADPAAVAITSLQPEPVPLKGVPGELRIISSASELNISNQIRDKKTIDSLIASAHRWNLEHGFYPAESEARQVQQQTKPSWWQRRVVVHLSEFIREYFGEDQAARKQDSGTAGNLGALYFSLSQQPPAGKPIVVHFGRESGDASINLIEGGRLVFDENNWHKTAIALIQLDPKLQQPADGEFQTRAGNVPFSWSITFTVLGILFIIFFIYHRFMLPYPAIDTSIGSTEFVQEFFRTFSSFFKRKRIGAVLAFLLLYRFGEAQLVKLVHPFLLDSREVGGLALTTGQVGLVYGTIGIMALTLGGILGGLVIPRRGLRFWIYPMLLIIHLPDLAFIYLSHAQPDSLFTIAFFVALEQFGYGFGFTAYMLYMIYVSEGAHKTAHYAICTGLMALGMMVPGLFSGWLQELIGYKHFFIWVVLATIPSFIAAYFIPLDTAFGKKK